MKFRPLLKYALAAAAVIVTFSPTFANCPAQSVPAPAGLVAWWPANSNAVDVAGGNNGTLTNGVAYVPGEVEEAFDPTNDHAGVFIGNPPALQLQNFTIEAWVKRATTAFTSDDPSANGGAAAIFYFGSQGYGMGMHSDGAISLTKIDVDDVNDDAYGASITDTDWHHVAVTKSNTVVSFYIDGVAYPSVTYTSIFQFTTPAAIGVRGDNINANNNDSFAGAIDELSIYDRALTPAEILAIYNAGSAGKYLTAPPDLGITSIGSVLQIDWPATGSYTVKQTTNLAYPASWANSTNVVNMSNGTNSITFTPPLTGNLFFRLANP